MSLKSILSDSFEKLYKNVYIRNLILTILTLLKISLKPTEKVVIKIIKK